MLAGADQPHRLVALEQIEAGTRSLAAGSGEAAVAVEEKLGIALGERRQLLVADPDGLALALVDGNRLPALPCRARAVIDGDVETGSVMAGQSVGMVTREEPVADIIRELADEAAAALESRG